MPKLTKKIGLLLIGGKHHILHLIPISKSLSKFENVKVTIFVTTQGELELCADILAKLNINNCTLSILSANKLLRKVSPKLAILFSNIMKLKRLDALIVAERTSTILRYLSRRLPHFIHIPHGAGDRAKSYDPRIRHFDHVLVAGEKDKKRMLDLGLVSESTCHVTGYIKPYAVNMIRSKQTELFENNYPIVLYNPHFNSKLTSWERFGFPLLERFSRIQNLNFIFAPHIRLFKKASAEERRKLGSFTKFANIHVDLGSVSSTDMTYTNIADIYLGDVSSQVYEFLSSPKPCVFIDAHETNWQNDPDYAHWHYGKVCASPDDILEAVKTAHEEHFEYENIQRAGCLAAKGDPDWNPISRAAEIVMSILNRSDKHKW